MNDPRETVAVGSLVVESFGVNDERALKEEIEGLQGDAAWKARTDDERPSAAVAVSDGSFGFFVWWKNRHIDEEIIRKRVSAEHDAQARLLDLKRMAGGS
jgi:hypothetical protein